MTVNCDRSVLAVVIEELRQCDAEGATKHVWLEATPLEPAERPAPGANGTLLGPWNSSSTTKPPQMQGFRRWAILGSNQ
jgi:hypothetical protein